MKFIFLLSVLTGLSFANDSKKQENLAKIKAETISHIDKRISVLQETKSCVHAATEHNKIKECQNTKREKMKALHKERKEKRVDFREEMKSKREELRNKKRD